jgi:hypothetical protein
LPAFDSGVETGWTPTDGRTAFGDRSRFTRSGHVNGETLSGVDRILEPTSGSAPSPDVVISPPHRSSSTTETMPLPFSSSVRSPGRLAGSLGSTPRPTGSWIGWTTRVYNRRRACAACRYRLGSLEQNYPNFSVHPRRSAIR